MAPELRMPRINHIALAGKVCTDVRFDDSKNTVKTRLRLLVDDSFMVTGGRKVNRTSYFNILFTGKVAENAFDLLDKGKAVYVEGSIHSFRYEDSDPNNPHFGVEVRASGFQLLEQPFVNLNHYEEERDDD